jgi:hypothetical protein
VQRRREMAAAEKLMRKLLKKQGFAPDVLVVTAPGGGRCRELEPHLLAAGRFFEQAICAGLASLAEELNPPSSREDFEPMTWAAIERGRRLIRGRYCSALFHPRI